MHKVDVICPSRNKIEGKHPGYNCDAYVSSDSDQSNFSPWPAEQISRCECNLLFLTRKRGRNRRSRRTTCNHR
ncbi:hypothetical protein PUN28_018271 [Cardiocondyla obscurior]|uniref:Uncharacterized protein n=1 Tax=Cardiocondyla obscurior TaxID=286306 RepID=A0AAW2EI62_9HYME